MTALVGWVPFVGWVLSLYRLYLATVGIREIHGTTTSSALPVVVPCILVLVVVVVVGASAVVYFRAA